MGPRELLLLAIVLAANLIVCHGWAKSRHQRFHKPHHDEHNLERFIDKYVLIAVGGLDDSTDDKNNNVEIFDFLTNTSCYGPAFPKFIHHHMMAYTDHQLIVCGNGDRGGVYSKSWSDDSSDRAPSKECFALESSDQKWYPVQEMDRHRIGSPSVVLHDGHEWWLAGGANDPNKEIHSRRSIIFTKNNYWAEGPETPNNFVYGCGVNINDNETAIIGGHYDGESNDMEAEEEIFIYNWNTDTWREVPMYLPRSFDYPGCTLIDSPHVTNNPVVIIQGDVEAVVWDTMTNTMSDLQTTNENLVNTDRYNNNLLNLAGSIAVVPEITPSSTTQIYGIDLTMRNGQTEFLYGEWNEVREHGQYAIVPRNYAHCRA